MFCSAAKSMIRFRFNNVSESVTNENPSGRAASRGQARLVQHVRYRAQSAEESKPDPSGTEPHEVAA